VSAISETRSGWLKQYYDKVMLVLLLAGLLASAAILWRRIEEGRQLLVTSGEEHAPSRDQFVTPLDEAAMQTRLAGLRTPFEVKPRAQRLFVSETRTTCLKCGKPVGMMDLTCPFCGFTEEGGGDPAKRDSDGDGMPDLWEERYSLNPMNPDDAHLDSDGDGFTNVEEFLAGTDPRDPSSMPELISKLRMSDRPVRETLRIRFEAVQELLPGQKSFQLNVGNRTYFKRIGDSIPEEGVQLLAYNEDERTLRIRQGARELDLRMGVNQSGGDFIARFLLLVDRDRRPFTVKVGQEFKVRDASYRLIEITPDEMARVAAVAGGKEYLVPMITEREKSDTLLPGPGPTDAAEADALRAMEREMMDFRPPPRRP